MKKLFLGLALLGVLSSTQIWSAEGSGSLLQRLEAAEFVANLKASLLDDLLKEYEARRDSLTLAEKEALFVAVNQAKKELHDAFAALKALMPK